MSKSIDFHYDVGSPTAYLAWTQLPAIAAEAGAELVYRPMLLGGVFKATGNASPVEVPAKGRWMFEDMARFARRYGVALNVNPHFPINTLYLMRGAIAELEDGDIDAYNRAMFEAIWVHGKNMNDTVAVGMVLSEAGYDPEAFLERISRDQVKAALKSASEAAVARGVFGAPTMFVGEEMFFGQDRLEFVREALAA